MPCDNFNLTPEQRKAIKVVQECLPLWNEFMIADPSAPEVCITDSKAFVLQNITYSNLHHGNDWIWNQSNAKKTVAFENDINVVVQKFNTRKKNKSVQSAGIIFKLWMFYVYKQSDFLGVFIWCEKGYPPTHFTKNIDCYILSDKSVTYENNYNNYNYGNYNIYNNYPATCESALHEKEEDSLINLVANNLTLEDLDFLKPFVPMSTTLICLFSQLRLSAAIL